jgi:hypothetical protein
MLGKLHNWLPITGRKARKRMPIAIRKLEAEEAARAFARAGRLDVGEYADALRGLRAGDAIAVSMDHLSSRTLKRRFSLAAKQLGYRITWAKQVGDGEVYLRVVQVPVDGTSWGGRPRKARARQAAASQLGLIDRGARDRRQRGL